MNRRDFVLATLNLSSAIAAASSLTESRASNPTKKLELEDLMDVTSVPGTAIAGWADGRRVAKFGGVRSASTGEPITEDTVFPAASLSKVVFAWGVRNLVRKGKIDWRTPLSEYANLGLGGSAKRITAEHVLSHTTGLPNWRLEESAALTCAFEPGTKWGYSGEGFFLLQRVVESVLHESAASYMKREILPGVGIASGSYAWTPDLQSKAVDGHDGKGAVLEKSLLFYENQNFEVLDHAGLNPQIATIDQIADAYKQSKKPVLPILISPNMAGSLWLRPSEYAKFIETVMADIALSPDDYRARVEVNRSLSWTLGWGLDRSAERPALFVFGDAPGIKNFVWIDPKNRTAIVIFTNGERGALLYGGVLRRLAEIDSMALYWV